MELPRHHSYEQDKVYISLESPIIQLLKDMLQVEAIERICNVTHAYNKKINFGQELIIELTYNVLTPEYHDTFACGVYYYCKVSVIS